MPPLKHLAWVENAFDPRLSATFRELSKSLDNAANTTGVSGQDLTAPPNLRSIAVTAANGVFDIVLSDPVGQGGNSLGVNYFVDWSTTASFANFRTIHLGPSRSWYGFLGSQTLFFRAYSQYPASTKSKYVYFGGPAAPTGVPGGGAIAGPAPAAASGSGGRGGRGGFGGQ
jgi:hypothetical protein